MKVAGNIPKDIIYISRQPEMLETKWDNSDTADDIITKGVYKPSFPSDAINAKTIETGISWASGYRNGNQKHTTVTYPNDPMKDLRLVGLEKRSEGGRAYKVVIHGDILVDLREDVLLELMIEEGIGKNGMLKGLYVWGKVGSQMKLVRVGSALYDALVANTKLGKQPKLKKLEIGGVYRGKSPNKYVYLGNFSTVEITTQQKGHSWNAPASTVIEYRHHDDVMLFLKWPVYFGKTIEEVFDPQKDNFGSITYTMELKKSHTMLEKVDQFTPIDILGYINSLSESKKFPPDKMKMYQHYAPTLSKLACMREAGSPFKVPAIFEPYIKSGTLIK